MHKVSNDIKRFDAMRIMQKVKEVTRRKVKDVDLGQGSLPRGDNDLLNW